MLDGEFAKDGRLLSQITDAEAGAAVHGEAGDVVLEEMDGAFVGADDADDHVEGGGLAGAVGAEEADDLAGADVNGDAVDDAALVVLLD